MQYYPDDLSNNPDSMNEFLTTLYPYILKLAHQYILRYTIPQDIIDLEIDDIAQVSLIKIWDAIIKHKNITNFKAYVRSIVHNEAINLARSKHRQICALPLDNYGELQQGSVVAAGQPPQEPGDEIEQEETLTHYTITVVNDIQPLPPRQKDAFMQSLKDQIGDILPIVDALIDHGIDVNAVEKAQGKKEQQQLRASLSVARKKFKMENYNFPF
jgi:RNA polymerase sigma factor (sigma-70 family)